MSIVVTCATAKTGSATVRALAALKPQAGFRAVVRSEAKGEEARKLGAEVAVSDIHDAGFADALEGARAVFVMNPIDCQPRSPP